MFGRFGIMRGRKNGKSSAYSEVCEKSGESATVVVEDEPHEFDPRQLALPKLPSTRARGGVMFSLSRDVLRMPINEGDSLTYGDVFYANKFVRESGDNPDVVAHLIRREHESAADLLAWCRNDVAVAISVAEAVCRLRLAIVMSDNS